MCSVLDDASSTSSILMRLAELAPVLSEEAHTVNQLTKNMYGGLQYLCVCVCVCVSACLSVCLSVCYHSSGNITCFNTWKIGMRVYVCALDFRFSKSLLFKSYGV